MTRHAVVDGYVRRQRTGDLADLQQAFSGMPCVFLRRHCSGLGHPPAVVPLAIDSRPRCTMHLHLRTVLCALLRWSIPHITTLRPNTVVFGL